MFAVRTFGVWSDSPFARAQVNPNSYYESMGRAGQRGGERERQLATFSRNAIVAAEVRSAMVRRLLGGLLMSSFHGQAQKTPDVSCMSLESWHRSLVKWRQETQSCALSHRTP